VDEIVALLASEVREGDRVVVLSNGGFGGIHEKLLRALGAAP
jgi:UDP-N-acetylmuramate: L-alanyl-gamma-D-glutamyl-meso-diaminopimelate ligase